ncbi:MAG: hypothetical protein GY701_28775 [Sulfitobacter sp.]|nr:hypothetical protein [Sulfitobacter sp.]
MPIDLSTIPLGVSERLRQRREAAGVGLRHEPPAESFSLFDYALDMGKGLGRGAEGFLQGIYGLGDMMLGDSLPDWENRVLGRSATLPGGLVEGMTNFMLGFIPVAGWIGRGAHLGSMTRPVAGLRHLSKAAGVARGKPFATRVGRDVVAGAITDFSVFDGHEARLSNLIQQYPELQNPITAFLGADPDDPESTARLKGALEGLPLGLIADGLTHVLGKVVKGRRARDAGKSPDEVNKILEEGLDQDLLRSDIEKVRKADEVPPKEVPPEVRETGKIFDEERPTGPEISDNPLQDLTTGEFTEEIARHPKLEDYIEEKIRFLEGGGSKAEMKAFEVSLRNLREEVAKGLDPRDADVLDEIDRFIDEAKKGNILRGAETEFDELNLITREVGEVKGSPTYSTRLEDGTMLRITRANVPGKKKKTWIDADTGAEIKGAKNQAEAEAAMLRDHQVETPQAAPVELPQGTRDLETTLNEFRARVAKGEGYDNINPRDLSVEELVERGLKENNLNLARMDAEPASVVRTIDKMYEAAWPDEANPVSNAVLKKASSDDLSDLIDGEAPMGILSDKDLRTAKQLSIRKLTWRTILRSYADEFVKVSREVHEAPMANRDMKIAELALVRDRIIIADRTVKGLAAISGRDLQAFKIPYTGYASLADALKVTGGDAALLKLAKKVTEGAHLDGGDAAAALRLAKHTRRSKLLDMTIEYWINSILSGGKTWSINFISGAMQSVYRPFEKLMGSTFTLDFPGMRDALREFTFIVDATMSAFRPAFRALRENQPQLLPNAKATEMREMGISPALTTGNINQVAGRQIFDPNSGWGRITDFILSTARIPSAVLTGTDEFIKQINYNVHAKSLLTRKAIDEGFAPSAAVARANRQVDDLTFRFQAITEETLFRKNLEEIERTMPHLSEVEMAREAIARARKEWNPEEGALSRLVSEDAGRVADEVAFTNPIDPNGTHLDEITAGMQRWVAQHPSWRFILTFIRTPYNILRWARDRSVDPVIGMARMTLSKKLQSSMSDGTMVEFLHVNSIRNRFLRDVAGDVDLHGVDPNSAEAKVIIENRKREAVGRLATGVGIFTTFMTLASKGGITGAGPKDKEQRRLLEQAGWQPYSFKVGDSYIEYRRLDPFATLIGTIADYYDVGRYASDEDQGMIESMGVAMAISLANNATNKTYMTGIKNLLDGLSAPADKGPRILRNYVTSFIPTGPSQASKFAAGDDPAMREIRDITDAIKNKLPYLGDEIDPVRNFLGEPVRKITSFGEDQIGQVANLFIPIAYREVSDNMIAQELATLQHPFSPPQRKAGGVNLGSYRNERGQSAYDRMLQLRSDVKIGGRSLKAALRDLIRSATYQAMSPESTVEFKSPRVNAINRVVQRYHRAAVRKMRREFPDVAAATLATRRQLAAAKFGALQQFVR